MRLVHQLSLTLLGTTVLAVLAMGGFSALHLREGFSDYLRAQDERRLQSFAGIARAAIEQHGLEGLARNPRLLRAPAQVGGPPPERPRADPPPGPGRPPGRPGEPDPEQQMAQRGLSLVASDGELIWGRPPPPDRRPLEAAVRLDGRTVATARLVPRPEGPEGLDLRFLQRQLGGLALVGLLVALVGAACAGWLARRWLRPLTEVQRASHALALGNFALRLPRREGKARDEFEALADDINHLAEALETLETSRRRWLAELSHELRTPLTVLRGELDAVRDGVRPLNAERVDSLSREVNRLRRLADDFHGLALADLQALPCQPQALDPAELLRRAVARHQAGAAAAGLALELTLRALPPQVQWDGERIEQVLDNLLANALAYTDAPGRIVMTARSDADGVLISLDDSPPAVPPELLPRLFDPLFRADPARQRRDGAGSGLGLSIARAWVLRHGGRIAAQASPLGGLGMSVWLPERARE